MLQWLGRGSWALLITQAPGNRCFLNYQAAGMRRHPRSLPAVMCKCPWTQQEAAAQLSLCPGAGPIPAGTATHWAALPSIWD